MVGLILCFKMKALNDESMPQGQSAGASGVGGPVPMPVNLHNALGGAHGTFGLNGVSLGR